MSLASRWVAQALSLKASEHVARVERVNGRPCFKLWRTTEIEYASVDDDGRLEIYGHERLDQVDALRFGEWLVATYGEPDPDETDERRLV